MAGSLNRVEIIGNLGADPETRVMPSGSAVTNIRVATSEKWKDKDSGENKERTEWHSVAFFGKLAEIAGEYLKKGDKAFIAGQLRTRKWQDKAGNDRYTTEIIANEMIMLGSPNGQRREGGRQQDDRHEDVDTSRPARGGKPPPPKQNNDNEFDDDIPF